MTKRERELERILILRTLMQYEPMPAARLADIASSECDHDALDALPEVSRRGIGQRLNAMSLDGLVTGEPQRSNRLSERVMLWSTTEKGRALAGTLGSWPEPSSDSREGRLAEEVECLRSALRDDPSKWSFETLMLVGDALLAEVYPAEVFDGSSDDAGARLVAALRDCRAAHGGRPR